jgi:hypothetical protein
VMSGERITSTVLPDGTPACVNHPELAATYRCAKCQQTLCESCVRMVRRMAGETLVFCTLCAGACEFLGPVSAEPAHHGPVKKTFIGRLTQSLHLPFKL